MQSYIIDKSSISEINDGCLLTTRNTSLVIYCLDPMLITMLTNILKILLTLPAHLSV